MGHTDVFVHVGDRVRIQAPDGKYVAPLVTGAVDSVYVTFKWCRLRNTGTFGSSDFIHSLLGGESWIYDTYTLTQLILHRLQRPATTS